MFVVWVCGVPTMARRMSACSLQLRTQRLRLLRCYDAGIIICIRVRLVVRATTCSQPWATIFAEQQSGQRQQLCRSRATYSVSGQTNPPFALGCPPIQRRFAPMPFALVRPWPPAGTSQIHSLDWDHFGLCHDGAKRPQQQPRQSSSTCDANLPDRSKKTWWVPCFLGVGVDWSDWSGCRAKLCPCWMRHVRRATGSQNSFLASGTKFMWEGVFLRSSVSFYLLLWPTPPWRPLHDWVFRVHYFL